MQCPLCGYMMSAFDKDCPRCHGKGIAPPPLPQSPPAPTRAPQGVPTVQAPPRTTPPRGATRVFTTVATGTIGVLLSIGLFNVFANKTTPQQSPQSSPLTPTREAVTSTATPQTSVVMTPIPNASLTVRAPVARQSKPVFDREISPIVYRSGQSFQDYGDQCLTALSNTKTPHEAAGMGLYWLARQSEASDEAQRANVVQNFTGAFKLGRLASFMGTLADAAAERARFLDGLIGEREYRIGKSNSRRTLEIVNLSLDRREPTPEERKNQRTLDAVNRGMNQ